MNISFVIPNFNGAHVLEKNLLSIFAAVKGYTKGSVDIVLADDASKDDSLTIASKLFEKHCPKNATWQVLENSSGKNKGFATNVNKGVAATKGDIVVLLNTDVVVEQDFLAPLLSHFSDEHIFAVGCLDKSIENGKVILRGRGKGVWKRGFLMHRAGDVSQTDTLWVSCGSGAFRKNIWEKLGGLDELYNPFYWEDIDLSYRAQKAGFAVVFQPKSVVVHRHEEGSIKKQYSRFFVKAIAYRNQFFFTWLNATDTILIASQLAWLPVFFFKALLNRDRAFFYGFLMAIGKLPTVLSQRRKVRKLFLKTDKEITERYL